MVIHYMVNNTMKVALQIKLNIEICRAENRHPSQRGGRVNNALLY